MNGVSVELWNTDGKVGDAVTTNAQGEAVFSQITAGEYTIKIVSDDYAYDKEVTIAKSLVDCTTEVSVTALVAYTVTLTLPEGVEASVFNGVTATLKGTEATGELQNGTVTFTQKVKLGVYEIVIEKDGYIVKGSTVNDNLQAIATVTVVSTGANIITGGASSISNSGDTPEVSQLKDGKNVINIEIQGQGSVWFKGAGTYTFAVTNSDLYLKHAYTNLTTGASYATRVQLIKSGAAQENSAIVSTVTNNSNKVTSLTVTLTKDVIFYMLVTTELGTVINVDITKNA